MINRNKEIIIFVFLLTSMALDIIIMMWAFNKLIE